MKRNSFICFLILSLVACHTAKQNTSNLTKTNLDKQGHRGCRGLMPENTIPAMIRAIDLGVNTLEMDLVISKDKKVVVSHDVYFNEKITTTPEGNFLTKAEAGKRLLYSMNYDSIRKYDVGLKPHPDFPRQEKIAVHKPLLSDLLEATEAYGKQKGKELNYNIEIKSNPENDGKKHPEVGEFVDLAIKVIKEKGVFKRATIQSFDPRSLQYLHKNYPDAITSLLIEDSDHRPFEEQLQELGFTPSAYSPHFSLVTPELVKKCHEKKILLIPWTINNIDEMRKQIKLGVDGIISDYPDLFSQL